MAADPYLNPPVRECTITGMWEDYRKKVLPPDAIMVQVVECRKAFFAGAIGLKGTLERLGEMEDAGRNLVPYFQKMEEDVQAFADETAAMAALFLGSEERYQNVAYDLNGKPRL